jgi:hypothetical protein
VKTADVAAPDASVTAVFVFDPPANEPLGTLEVEEEGGAANVTVTLGIALRRASLTVATSRLANAVLTVALWGVPPVGVIVGAQSFWATYDPPRSWPPAVDS